MRTKIITPVLFFAALTILCSTLLTQGAAAMKPQQTTAALSVQDESSAGPITIYSNLGPRNDVYDKLPGWEINGTKTQFPQWVAMPFHIKEDATITQIKIPMQYGSGTNGFTLTLTEDDHCLPTGEVKGKWEVKNLSPARSCCALKVVNAPHGIPVSKGEIYWIVAQTDSTDGTTSDNWPYTWNHVKSHDIAIRAMPFVWIRYHGTVCAFAVYGTKR